MNKTILTSLPCLLLSALALGLFAACQRSAVSLSPADIEAVKANYTNWGTAVGKRDYDAMSRLMADDTWTSNPNESPMVGRAAAIDWVKTWAPDVKHVWEVQEVVGYADMAFSRATVTAIYTGKDGKKATERHQSVCLHRRQPDGRWVFARAMNVPLDPLPASAAAGKP